ncbi:hypothetical protein LUZ60_003050 [Juncus effusus]|nr:hypothetical protein LUZ60_003050 [Juncus effusus]
MEFQPLNTASPSRIHSRASCSSFVLSFTDLTYSVRAQNIKAAHTSRIVSVPYDVEQPPSTKTLLDKVSGEARQGEILAVLGPSGSGKSTLLDALANRISRLSLQGTITLNGEALKGGALLKVISTYVMQDDLLYPMLTVEETLMFAAQFRLPRSVSKREKNERVQSLIDQLGLRKAAGTIVGDEGHRGVSGGERRRVSIGVDVIHDPIILFLDEPISGLDSTSAFMVIKVLHQIAERGSIVIMSIHQPSSRILNLLDRMLFLSRGRTIYYGPPGNLPKYFSDFGMPIPREQNSAEFVLDLVHNLQEEERTDPTTIRRLVGFNRSWGLRNVSRRQFATSTYATDGPSLREIIVNSIPHAKLVDGSMPNYANHWWTEVWILMKRATSNSKRMPEIFLTQLAAVIVTALISASLFKQLDHSSMGVTERLGFFSVATSTMFFICVNALPVFVEERYIFFRETSHNAYRRSSYVISRAISSFPSLVVYSVVFSAITYFPVGLDGGFNGFLFYSVCILAAFWSGSGFASFLSGILSELVSGFAVVIAMLRFFLVFSGFYIHRDRIPKYWLWFHYLGLMKYPYQAAMINEFSNNASCYSRGVQLFDNTIFETQPNGVKAALLPGISEILRMNITTETCMMTGPDVLRENAVSDLSKWGDIWVQVAFGFLLRFLFYIELMIGGKNKRH